MKETAREKSKRTNKEYVADILWEEVVRPAIDKFKSGHKGYKLNVRNQEVLRVKFINLFNYYNKLILSQYMVSSERIDRHKIGAICIKVIKIIKPFKITFKDKWQALWSSTVFPEEKIIANEQLAIHVAYKIVNSYINSNTDENVFRHRLVVPEPFIKPINENDDGMSQYLKNCCADLYFSSKKEVNIITYANVLFLIEKYSCRKEQCENLEEYLRERLYEDCKDEFEIDDIISAIKFGNLKKKNQ